MKSLKCAMLAALASVLAAMPALAQKEIVVDNETARVYPLEDGRLARAPMRANNRQEFAWKDIGTFRISEKVEDKRSNLYNIEGDPIRPGDEGARMRYWMRLGGSAQGFHLSPLFQPEGSPHRSHGCYRLSRKSATWLFGWAPVGTPVHVVRSVKASRFAGLLGPRPVVARRASAPKPVARAPRRTQEPTVTIRPARPTVTIRPAPRPSVVIKPAPKPARASSSTRVTITRVAERTR